jgi:F0F1-type ATP synthase assembly protein I
MGDDNDDSAIDAWTLVGLGSMLVGCVVAGLVLGELADSHWDSSPTGILVGLAIGIVVGIVGSWLRIARFLRG